MHNIVAIDSSVDGFLFAIHDCGDDLSFQYVEIELSRQTPSDHMDPTWLSTAQESKSHFAVPAPGRKDTEALRITNCQVLRVWEYEKLAGPGTGCCRSTQHSGFRCSRVGSSPAAAGISRDYLCPAFGTYTAGLTVLLRADILAIGTVHHIRSEQDFRVLLTHRTTRHANS